MPWIVILMGFPGTGKLTVARALAARLERDAHPTHLIDNTSINNVILQLIDADETRPVPANVWDRISEVRAAMVQTIQDAAPRDRSYIFTNHLVDDPASNGWIARLAAVAHRRDAHFVPIRLLCEQSEVERRVASPERLPAAKETNPGAVRARFESERTLATGHPNELSLDTTSLPAADAAAAIHRHLTGLNAHLSGR